MHMEELIPMTLCAWLWLSPAWKPYLSLEVYLKLFWYRKDISSLWWRAYLWHYRYRHYSVYFLYWFIVYYCFFICRLQTYVIWCWYAAPQFSSTQWRSSWVTNMTIQTYSLSCLVGVAFLIVIISLVDWWVPWQQWEGECSDALILMHLRVSFFFFSQFLFSNISPDEEHGDFFDTSSNFADDVGFQDYFSQRMAAIPQSAMSACGRMADYILKNENYKRKVRYVICTLTKFYYTPTYHHHQIGKVLW